MNNSATNYRKIERLRKLLNECKSYVVSWPEARELFNEIEKEYNDE